MRMRRETLTTAAVAVAMMIFAAGAVAQNAALDEYSGFVPDARGDGPAENGPGGPDGSGRADGAGGGAASRGSPEFEALRERLARSGALDAPGFSNLLKSFRGLDGESAVPIDASSPDGAAARPASTGADGDRTGLLLIVLALSTIAVTGLGVAFKRRRDGLPVRQ